MVRNEACIIEELTPQQEITNLKMEIESLRKQLEFYKRNNPTLVMKQNDLKGKEVVKETVEKRTPTEIDESPVRFFFDLQFYYMINAILI